jgi:hypothetical protein
VKHGGRVVYGNRLQFPYGLHGFSWVPRAPGRYAVTFTTIDYLNHQTVSGGQVTVKR